MELDKWLARLPVDLQTVVTEKSEYSLLTLVSDIPRGKGRPRFTRSGRCYTPGATKQAEQATRLAARGQGDLLVGPLGILVLAVFPIPKSWSKKKRQDAEAGRVRPAVKPDFDNVAKLYCDALNGLMWEDDKQIVDGRCIKAYGQQPGVLVMGWPIG